MKTCSSHFKTNNFRSCLWVAILTANLSLFPSKTIADYYYDFVRLEIAQAYLKDNPYLITFTNSDQYPSYLFKVEKVYMEESRMMISGPVVLKWVYKTGYTYTLPDSAEINTEELCGNYHYGYYAPMRLAFPLMNLLNPTGGTYSPYACSRFYPAPEVIPDVNKDYGGWLDQLPEALKEYCIWWYKNASIGPPVLHDLIDSVLSVPEGGRKAPPPEYVDIDHCPGEGCTFGEWQTTEDIAVYDAPKSTKIIATLRAGETFTAITGNVYLKPMENIVTESIEVYDTLGSLILEPGRKYYTLSNIGEGHSYVWVNGRIMISSDSPYNESQAWWVKVKIRQGKTGWIVYPDSGCITGSDFLANIWIGSGSYIE